MYKMPNKEYYQKNKENYWKRASDFYENNKEMIKEQGKIKYYKLSPEEKNKQNEYAKTWYNNLPEDKKKTKRDSPDPFKTKLESWLY